MLDLFCGTCSVSNVAKEMGFEVTTLDLHRADINCDIMEWDFRKFPPHYFDVIWASCPCETFSSVRRSLVGRYGYTRESIERDMMERGVPLLRKTEEIIDYFEPTFWFIENPQTGRMKEFITKPFYDVDYCRYGFPYKKRTRIWTNLDGFDAKLCNKQCGFFENGRHLMCATGSGRGYKGQGSGNSRDCRYKIPPQLIHELFILCNTNSDATA